MKKSLVLLLFFGSLFFSCKKKQVHLPKVPLNGLENMENHSAIWIFENNGKADLNQNNRITSTHWLFHIDKTLPLKEVVPTLKELLIKHNKKSPHKVEGMNNYISYVNSLNDKLSFYSFDSIKYRIIKKDTLPFYGINSDTVMVFIQNPELIKVDTNKINIFAFSENVSLQDYMQVKAKTDSLIHHISTIEYIFSE